MCDLGLIEEYKSLRKEILQRQRFRIWTISFTIAAVGTILGIVFSQNGSTMPNGENIFIGFLICFILVLINGALVLTIENTQQIHIISKYIIKFIESKCPPMNWETSWTEFWNMRQSTELPLPGYPWAVGRSHAFFYIILTLTVVGALFIKSLGIVATVIAVILIISSFWLSADLYFRISKGWENPWP